MIKSIFNSLSLYLCKYVKEMFRYTSLLEIIYLKGGRWCSGKRTAPILPRKVSEFAACT